MYDRHSAKFPFKKTLIYLLRHFHCSTINFKLKCVLFHVNKIQFYEGHFRMNMVSESTIPRITVVLLFYVHGKHLRSCRDGQLT